MTSTKGILQKNFQTYLFWGPQDAPRAQTLKLTKSLSINIEKPSQDITFISAKKSSISIDQIREIKKNIFQKPLIQKFKVVIIENAQKLTLPAQNALLKVLEEPPTHAIIILEANSQKALVPTIISRAITKQATYKLPRPKRPRYSPLSLHEQAGNSQVLGSMYSQARIQPNAKSIGFSASEYKKTATSPDVELQSGQILSQISQINDPLIWLDSQILNTYEQLLDAISQKKPDSEVGLHKKVIQNCLAAKKMIEANVNAKFVLFNLIFSLHKINI